jgi:phosphoribosylformylglycinamidine cyclo-ligase
MPDLYQSDDYDLAGFCVGVVEKKNLITGRDIAPGDVILGINSSGVHSNGFRLVRKAVFEKGGLAIDSFVPELGMTVGDALLTPTLIYSKLTRTVLNHYKVKNVVHGIGHITGGGLLENTERILQPNVDLVFERGSWPVLPVFDWIAKLGEIESSEMEHVFNMGIGLVLIVSPFYAPNVKAMVESQGFNCWNIGTAQAGTGKSRYAS